MIKKYSHKFSIKMMCRLLSVSSSGFYDWCNRLPSLREQEDAELALKIKDIFEKEKSRAGAIRISKRLKMAGVKVGRHRVAKIMKHHGLRAKATRKYKATTNSNHKLPVAPNLLEQNFKSQKPNEKWVSDITYVWTEEGWLYLAAVVDLYSRMVVGWAMSERMTTPLVADALKMALFRRGMPHGVIVHSDRGVQYCSHDYQKLLKANHLICSMSKKGDCFDNAAMESWNHSLKVEAIHGEKFKTRTEAKNHIFDYIEVYYNKVRLHSKLGYCSPEFFEVQKVA
jgi:transposase InsO family protein